jgi:hypothetical protein
MMGTNRRASFCVAGVKEAGSEGVGVTRDRGVAPYLFRYRPDEVLRLKPTSRAVLQPAREADRIAALT